MLEEKFPNAVNEDGLRTGPSNEYRDKHIDRMTAVAMWTVLIVLLGLGVAAAVRIFFWIWP